MYKKLKNMLCEELEELVKKGDLKAGSLEAVDKLTHSIKSLDTIMAMEESEYSNDYSYSGARRRNKPGRYAGRTYDLGYDGSYSERRYSREEGKSHMVHRLEEMMEDASGEEREVLKSALSKLANM